MHVVVTVPEPKHALNGALMKQFAQLQRQLMGLMKSQKKAKQSDNMVLLKSMQKQQDGLMRALERLMGSSHTSQAKSTMKPVLRRMDGLEDALRGSKSRNRTFGSNF